MLEGHDTYITAIAFSPDQQWLVTGDAAGNIRISEVATQALVAQASVMPPELAGFAEVPGMDLSPQVCAFSPDSQQIAVLCGAFLRLVDIEGNDVRLGEPIFVRNYRYLHYSVDGNAIALVGSGLAAVIDVDKQELVNAATVSTSNAYRTVASFANHFSPTGESLAGKIDEQLAILDAADLSVRMTLDDSSDSFPHLVFDQSGDALIAIRDSSVRSGSTAAWDLPSGTPMPIPSRLRGIGVVRALDGNRFVTWDKNDRQNSQFIEVWEGINQWSLNSRLEGAPYEDYHVVELSPNGRFLLTCHRGRSDDAPVRWQLRDLQQATVISLNGHIGAPTAVGFSPDGKYLVTASVASQGMLWDLEKLAGDAERNAKASTAPVAILMESDGEELVEGSYLRARIVHQNRQDRGVTCLYRVGTDGEWYSAWDGVIDYGPLLAGTQDLQVRLPRSSAAQIAATHKIAAAANPYASWSLLDKVKAAGKAAGRGGQIMMSAETLAVYGGEYGQGHPLSVWRTPGFERIPLTLDDPDMQLRGFTAMSLDGSLVALSGTGCVSTGRSDVGGLIPETSGASQEAFCTTSISLLDAHTGKMLKQHEVPLQVEGLHFNSQGELLIGAALQTDEDYHKRVVQRRSLPDFELVSQDEAPIGEVHEFSPAGDYLASYGDRNLYMTSLADGKVSSVTAQRDVVLAAFHPNGEDIVTSEGETVRTRRISDLSVDAEVSLGDLRVGGFLAVSPDGGAFAAMNYNQVQIRSLINGTLLSDSGTSEQIIDARFLPDGQHLVLHSANGFIHVLGARNTATE